MVVAFGDVRLARSVCPSPAESVAGVVAAVVILASLGVGLALLALAGRYASKRLARTRFVLVLVLPVVLVLIQLASTGPIGAGFGGTVVIALRALVLFGSLELIVVMVARTSARLPRRSGTTVALVLGGFAGCAAAVLVLLPVLGPCGADVEFGRGLAMLSFFALVFIPIVLIWLAAEGLRLSGNLATWALAHRSEAWLLPVLVIAKLVLVGVAAFLVVSGLVPPNVQSLVPTGVTPWVVATALVVVVGLLLTFETRLVSHSVSDFRLATRGFAFLVGSLLVALPLLGLALLFSALPGRPLLLFALVVAVLAGVVVGRLNRPPTPLRVAASAAVMAVGLALLLWAIFTSPPFVVLDISGALTTLRIGLLLGLFGIGGLVAVVVLVVRRPLWRRPAVFLVGLVLWVSVTVLWPAVTSVAVDVVLTLGIALLAIAGRLGWQRAVSAYELVLLLVTATVIVEVPLLFEVLPEWADLILLILLPALTALTLDAGPLNAEPADRPLQRYTTLGMLCLAYGLLGSLTLLVEGPRALTLISDIVNFFNGVAALPFAVILVAVMSAARQREAAAPVNT